MFVKVLENFEQNRVIFKVMWLEDKKELASFDIIGHQTLSLEWKYYKTK